MRLRDGQRRGAGVADSMAITRAGTRLAAGETLQAPRLLAQAVGRRPAVLVTDHHTEAGGADLPRRARAIPVPQAIAARVDELSRREGVTQFMILLAAFSSPAQPLLSGQEDIVVAHQSRSRGRIENRGSARFFVNTLVLVQISRGTRLSRNYCGACAKCRLAPPLIRICRSRSWSKSCKPSAI